MYTSLGDTKIELMERVAAQAAHRKGSGGPPPGILLDYLSAYYRHVASEDIENRPELDLYGAAVSQWKAAEVRPQATATVRVFTPSASTDGWAADGHTVVEVITDDMPFLVDSVTMELLAQNRAVHLVVHPQFYVRRDVAGQLLEVLCGDDDPARDASSRADRNVTCESWMHVEIDRETEPAELEEIAAILRRVLSDVRDAVHDWDRMRRRAVEIEAELGLDPPKSLPAEEIDEGRALLTWLVEDHFTFLGYREYRLEEQGDDEVLRPVPGTGLGILRDDPDLSAGLAKLPPLVREKAREKTLLVLAKANSKSTVHRRSNLDYIGVKSFDDAGEVIGERRFLGLYSSAAYTESLRRIPVLRKKAEAVLESLGFDVLSHSGNAMFNVLETYPRDELFQTPIDELVPIVSQVLAIQDRRHLRLFVRRDTYGRFLSCLVYLPRDRYNTTVRERIAAILTEQLGGESIEYTARVSESLLARLHFVVRPPADQMARLDYDVTDIQRRLAEAARSWRDDFTAALISEYGEEDGAWLAHRYADVFPESYKEDFSPRTGAVDLGRLEALPLEGLGLAFYEPLDAGPGEARLKVYRVGSPMSLSAVLPVFAGMGAEVVDERPYELDGLPHPSRIYDFGLRYAQAIPEGARDLFQDAVRAVWDGFNESDGFNALVLGAGLTWRQAAVLRAYAKYMRQGGTPFAQDYLEETLRNNIDITRLLVDLFTARFDPAIVDEAARAQSCEAVEAKIAQALDDVKSLDHDRILRSYLTVIRATVRTNYFRADADGAIKPFISFKLRPVDIPELPEPRPKYEIFVYSPRVEGVHLRFGLVARGGLRWSDRRDDFRTEVLGLVKAQMVKNTVIVPVGSKGGFFCKQLPDPSSREAWLAEGVACYQTFISGLLDVTDNLVGGQVVPPPQVVRHDGDDYYLVVAADKGTASFSDIANAVSIEYGYWLGDAFASGGSVGYDHKAMGITARGAWESVKRHFRDRGIDCQSQDFTCVGIGDMSGDVFGNGMLCSERTRLVAAFDHRDIFLDPDPDATISYAERKRLFELPRSSWQDYDKALISEGGGVFSRTTKKIPISSQVCRALALPEQTTTLTPGELITAILLADVDLLWNGGIGTYVKSELETNADVGDKANDAIRVDGGELRAKAVGEGGNLGFTQLGRIEYALAGCGGKGGRINTDFIDNSAGVDTSDHEVNIKILLDGVVAAGDLTTKQRGELLASMTDEVAHLVLRDNYEQNVALGSAAAQNAALLHVHEDWIQRLEREGHLDRELEFLPSTKQVRERAESKLGLTVPELAVILAYTKIYLEEELLDSTLPDDPFLRSDLFEYFPTAMRETYRDQMLAHPLHREIVVTQAVNELVNGSGITFFPRLSEETAASAEELVRANFVAREIFGFRELTDEINALDNLLPAALQTSMRLEVRTLIERVSRWLILHRRPPLDSQATVDFFLPVVKPVLAALPGLLTGRELDAFSARQELLTDQGVSQDLAARIASMPPAYSLLTATETAQRTGIDPTEVTRLHFALGERLGLSELISRILALPRDDRWQTMARAALREDLHAVHGRLTAQVLAETSERQSVAERIADWEDDDEVVVTRAVNTLHEICSDDEADLARLSVGLRVVRTLLRA